jgi:hypothetical protein
MKSGGNNLPVSVGLVTLAILLIVAVVTKHAWTP